MVEFSPTPISLIFVLSTLVLLLLAVYLVYNPRTSWRDPTTHTLIAVLLGAMVWAGAYGFHLLATTQAWKLLWFNLTQLGPSLLVPALLLHVATYGGHHAWFTRARLGLLAIEPTITAILIGTDPYHRLLRTDVEFVQVGATVVIHRGIGPWWFIRTTYLYLLTLVVFLVLVVSYRHATRAVQRQLLLGGIALAVPITVNLFFDLQFLVDPPVFETLAVVELTGAAMGVSGIILAYSVVRYRYFELGIAGRRLAIQHLQDPYVVVDRSKRIIDYNPIFHSLVDADGDMLGAEILKHVPELESILATSDSSMRGELRLERDDERWFETRIVPISQGAERSWRDRIWIRPVQDDVSARMPTDPSRVNGYVLVFRDITAGKRRERMLEVHNEQLELLNRIVSHDIHNEMDLGLGLSRRVHSRIREIERVDDNEDAISSDLERIVQSGNRVVELTESARGVVDALGEMDTDIRPIALKPVLEQELLIIVSHEDVVLEGGDDIPDVTVLADEMLSSVFRNLLRNAIVHNDNPEPKIDVDSTLGDGWVRIEIADNGPGIPAERRDALLDRDREIDTTTNGGFGLYLVRTLIDRYDASLALMDSEGGGTTVSVELRTVES